MKKLFILGILLGLTAPGVTAFAASAKVEGTPVPTPSKPDFSSMKFLIGTWQCADVSSRRPGPFTVTESYSLDPTGYWMLRTTTTHKASWIPRDFHGEAKFTYDSAGKHWIRIVTGDQGGYTVSTAPNPTGDKMTYTYVIQTKAPDIASYAAEVYVKESDTKKSMTTSFTELNGRVVTVKETCTKS